MLRSTSLVLNPWNSSYKNRFCDQETLKKKNKIYSVPLRKQNPFENQLIRREVLYLFMIDLMSSPSTIKIMKSISLYLLAVSGLLFFAHYSGRSVRVFLIKLYALVKCEVGVKITYCERRKISIDFRLKKTHLAHQWLGVKTLQVLMKHCTVKV